MNTWEVVYFFDVLLLRLPHRRNGVRGTVVVHDAERRDEPFPISIRFDACDHASTERCITILRSFFSACLEFFFSVYIRLFLFFVYFFSI